MSDINLLNIDPDRLFEQHTISEIVEITKKLQNEIEKKRQELRFMVGERYRDVLTAADTIQSMRSSAEKLRAHIHNINNKCYEIQSSTHQEETKPVVVDKLKNFYRSVAIQIKILILLPETIWTCLDDGDYLKAVQIYLLAIHIHTGLELDTEHKILEKFPILSRLRLSISSFRNRIQDGIKRRLRDVKLTSKKACSHLCAYILLENKTQESALQLFIELRQNSLHDLLHSDVSANSIVRTKILNLIHCLKCTIDLLHSCFVSNDNFSEVLLQTRLDNLLSSEADTVIKLIDLEPTPLLEYIPAIVNDFKPSCKESEVKLLPNVVEKVTKEWLEWTCRTLTSNLKKSLDVVTNVKALHTIREESYKIDFPSNWDQLCTDIFLPNKFNIWLHLFQPLISERAEELVCRRIQNNLQGIFEKISNDLNKWEDSEKDLRWYVWSEQTQDLGKDVNNHVGLFMRTKGYSPKVVELCETLDRTYLELLQDVSLYLYGTANNETIAESRHREEDKRLELYLRQECSTSIDKLIAHVEEVVNLDQAKNAVVGARLFQAIPNLCSHLKKCCSGAADHQQWDAVLQKLKMHCLQFWDYWLKASLVRVDQLASGFLMQDVQAANILHVLPKWKVIDIEEQTEEKVINSQIRVPMQPSISLLTFLSAVTSELNSIVPHTIPKSVHDNYIEGVVDIVLRRYEHLSQQESVNQNLALQFLLDVKFLTIICIRRDSKELMNKSQKIGDDFRGKVDPFDLDVFYPHLQASTKQSVLQMQMLLGCLLGSPNQLSSLGIQEQPNPPSTDREPSVLSVSVPSNDVWFPLLPVIAPAVKIFSTNVQQTSLQQPSSRAPVGRATSPGTTLVKSGAAALFEAMTNDWFS